MRKKNKYEISIEEGEKILTLVSQSNGKKPGLLGQGHINLPFEIDKPTYIVAKAKYGMGGDIIFTVVTKEEFEQIRAKAIKL